MTTPIRLPKPPEQTTEKRGGKTIWRRWCQFCGKSELVRSDLRFAKTCLACAKGLWNKKSTARGG